MTSADARAPETVAGAPAYSTRAFADYTGLSLDAVYDLIAEGTLEAEYVLRPGRRRGTYRIREAAFIACLKRLRWSHLPALSASPAP